MKPFERLNVEQRTPEWFEARFNHFTASDLGVLFDKSPYKTPLQVAEEKINKTIMPVSDQQRGLFEMGDMVEVSAREYLSESLNIKFEPAVLVHKKIPLLASLDGFTRDEKMILEAKYVGKTKVQEIKQNRIPEHHVYQVQGQLLVSGADVCFYFASDMHGECALVEVMPDHEIQHDIEKRVVRFMKNLKDGIKPEPTAKDYVEIFDKDFAMLCALKEAEDRAVRARKEFQGPLLERYKHLARFKSYGLRINRLEKKGLVQYKNIPELQGVDLNKYRGDPIISVTVNYDKE
jgi:putative phage-type endonuclease